MVRSPLLVAISLGLVLTPNWALAAETGHTFELVGLEVEVTADLGAFELSIETAEASPGLGIARLHLGANDPAQPPHLSLRFSMPSHDVHGVWTSGALFNKSLGPDWYPTRVTSTMTRHAPTVALFGADDDNRLTFAVSEALNPVELTAGVREEDARVYAGVELFTERHRPIREAVIELRLDRRDIPLHSALQDVSNWWAGQPGFEPAPVPEIARLPMYSTWYSYHQSVSAEALLREVEVGKRLGSKRSSSTTAGRPSTVSAATLTPATG